jgi:hypothetical protein
MWPTISDSAEIGKPMTEKNISEARPKASAGNTSGDMNRLSSSRAVNFSDRAIASDAATPKTTARMVVASATLKLLAAAKCNCQASISATYQRKE